MQTVRTVLAALSIALSSAPAPAETLPGPIPADVRRVIDGDTIEVDAVVWEDMRVTVSVRLRGVDTPELRGRCPAETALARQARDFVAATVGPRVMLLAVKADKYAGRVDAVVRLADGRDLSALLIAAGLGRPYDGGARAAWCP